MTSWIGFASADDSQKKTENEINAVGILKGMPAPFNGTLFTPEAANEVHTMMLENEEYAKDLKRIADARNRDIFVSGGIGFVLGIVVMGLVTR